MCFGKECDQQEALITAWCPMLVVTSASKSSIRRFVITEKAPTRAFSWLKAATTVPYDNCIADPISC